MKKILRNTALLALFSVLLIGCEDFIEKDIDDKIVSLYAPANNLSTIQLTHTFWWDWLEDAETYNMQLVEGSFTSVTALLLDTMLTINKFNYTLYPGTFQWRVKGINNGSETYYSTYTLTIDSSLDISSQQLILSSPADGLITNNDNVTFSWNSLLNADDYLLEVYQDTWGGTLTLGPQVETGTSYSTTLTEGTFIWGVQGRNAATSSSTAFSVRTITVDTTSPSIVTLTAPANNATLSDIYNTYTWTQGTNTGTALTDNISFYSDASATNLIKSAQVTSSSHQDSLGIGTFYWTVQSTDAAGNVGPVSTIRTVIIQ